MTSYTIYMSRGIRVFGVCALMVMTVLWFAREGATQSPDALSTQPKQARAEFVPGEVLVRFRSEAAARGKSTPGNELLIEGYQIPMSVEDLKLGDTIEGLRLVHVKPEDTAKAIEALNLRSDVLYAERNFIREKFVTPNDPLFPSLWGLNNPGQDLFGEYSGFIRGDDIHAEQAWNITTGSRNVVVGIVDGGIDINHPDLFANIWTNPAEISGNGLDDDGNGRVDDINGFDFFHNQGTVFDPTDFEGESHATHIAGTIGALGNNNIGVVGVNWEVSLMSLKVFGRTDEDPQWGNVAIFVRAYAYAKQMRDLWVSSGGLKGANIRVLNASIGGYGYSRAELDALSALDDSGVLFVAAAGNDTRNNDVFPIYPAGYRLPNIISVAASGPTDYLAFFSNVGNESVSLSAPGVSIQSTTPNGTYSFMMGTSMAAPHVAGATALICAKYPEITVKQLRAALIYNGDFNPLQLGKTLTARRLNVFSSLNAVAENDTTSPGPMPDFRILAQNGRTVTLGWTTPGDDGNVGMASIYQMRYSDHIIGSAADFDAATTIWTLESLLPAAAGTLASATVEVPYLHTDGYIALRATDNMGNTSPVAMLPVSVPESLTNLYDVTESAPQPLSTGGTQVPGFGRNPDDSYSLDYPLPFSFPYYGHRVRNVTVSTNGALYFSVPPKFLLPPMTGHSGSLDARNSLRALQTNRMIAGLWDDLVVTGVYAVTPDPNRIIFRWEGKTFDLLVKEGEPRGENPISFETELRADGTIQIRYGDGNKRLFPIVGISDGRPDAYVVNSHTSAEALMDLTAANTVTFSPRPPPSPPAGDLELVVRGMSVVNPVLSGGSTYTALPGAVAPGEVLQFDVVVTALGPDASNDVVLTAQLPAGTSFVGCDFSGVTCSGPSSGTDGGVVTANLGTLGQLYFAKAKGFGLQVKVTATPGTTLETRFSASSSVTDPNPINNNASATALVENYTAFNQVIAIDGSSRNTITLRQDGTVWFWGFPFDLDESVNNILLNPKQVDGLSNVIGIAGGGQHALALRVDGTVWSWGVNDRGQLGNQHIANAAITFPPTMIPGLSHIRAIAASRGASFAVDDQGLVWAWGDNTSGALGDGTTITRATPVQLQTISGVVKMATTGESTFAITTDGKLWSWGDNFYGQLGNGQTHSASLTPAPIEGLSHVRSVAADWIHTIALLDDGTVWTWGRGGSGELGNGTQNDSAVPIAVPNLTDVTSVDAGASASLALKADGRIWFWGDGKVTPRQVDELAGVKAIAAWNVQYAAIMADNSLQMWAYNSYIFQDGTLVPKPPAQIKWLPVVLTPRISAESSTYIFPRDVSIDCETPGAVIHYTTNGNDPTESDAILNPGTTVRIDRSMTVMAKAWKPGLAPSKVASASYAILVAGAPTPPQLILEDSGPFPNQAAAIDSVMNLRDPFPVLSAFAVQGSDRNTRVTIFLRSLQFSPGEMPSFVIVNLIDANSGNHDVPAEDVRTAFSSDLTQVTFRIPDNLPAGTCTVRVMAHGQMSNAGTIRIKG